MRRLTEYEIARVKNEMLILLWRKIYQMFIDVTGRDLSADDYDETKRGFDACERSLSSVDKMIMNVENSVANSLGTATMEDFGTWRDVVNYWMETFEPYLSLDEETE